MGLLSWLFRKSAFDSKPDRILLSRSDFFVVTLIGDVTVIQLLDAADYRDPAKKIELLAFRHKLLGLPQPAPSGIWQQLGHELRAILASLNPRKVVLDFASLERIGDEAVVSAPMNSSFCGLIGKSVRSGSQWRCCGLTEFARSFYEVSKLDKLLFLQIHDRQSEAVSAFSTTKTDST